MTILLIGGGTGGHITPLLAVARELKTLDPSLVLVGVCEKNSRFVSLYKEDRNIDRIFQVRAGKYRRYSGIPLWRKLLDVKTLFLNVRDVFRTFQGYIEAKRLLKELRPDIMLVKGGFVGVPMGLAAARLKIPFITHDSDSTPGLANRIIGRWARVHATAMPTELYAYPKEKTVYTGIPTSDAFRRVTVALQNNYRKQLGLSKCKQVIAVVGGSQGAGRLNQDILALTARLMERYDGLGVIHIVGSKHEKDMRHAYNQELLANERDRVIVRGFVQDMQVYTGAADLIVTRAGASSLSEFALQALPIIIVPGQLAGGHQDKNAQYLQQKQAAVQVPFGDREKLYGVIDELLSNSRLRRDMALRLHAMAKPAAAKELAELVLKTAKKA